MDWISTALLSAAILGVVNINDSHLLSRRLPGLRAFMLPVGVTYLIYGLLLFYLFPLPAGTGIWPLLAAIASGILRAAAIIIMSYNLQREEVSRVIPLVYTYPIFVAIMAVPLLGEKLYYLQWLAVIIVVAGAVVISAEKAISGSAARLGKPFLLLFAASLCFALADIASKYALAYISFWGVFYLAVFCIAAIFLLVSLRPSVFKQLIGMERRNPALALLVFNETLALIGVAMFFWALDRGPVSLVSTIIGSRPIFVAIYSLVLGRFWPEFLIRLSGKGELLIRLAATAMIVGGVAIIYLT